MRAWLTPNEIGRPPVCGLFWYPSGDDFETLPIGAYVELLFSENYEQYGALTPEETAESFQESGYQTARNYGKVWNAYTQKITAYHGEMLAAYWPLWEMLSATRARDLGALASHGVPTGGTFEATGIGDGMTAVTMSGSSSKIDVYSTALRDAFNADFGTLSLWASLPDWLAGGDKYLFALRSGLSYYFAAHVTSGYLVFETKSPAGTTKTASYQLPNDTASGYHNLAFRWSLTGGIAIALDGAVVATEDHPGTWGASKIAVAVLGAFSAAGAVAWADKLAHIALWSYAKNDADMEHLAYVQT